MLANRWATITRVRDCETAVGKIDKKAIPRQLQA
jgi:non-ribosomal peptide synthetase component E (peptide arylation enzyme)